MHWECVLFCVRIAEYQMKNGRFFYFEHPLSASSWNLEALASLREPPEVEDVVLHMCQFGLESCNSEGRGLVKKPTRIIFLHAEYCV